MKSKINNIIIIISIAVILLIAYFVGTGFMKRDDVVLSDYSVSDDGTKIILKTAVPTSAGYIRCYKNNGGGIKPHYLTFYSAFGGINGSVGAKNEFELELGKDDSEIYFNRSGGGYELVLEKNADTGKWEKPNSNVNISNGEQLLSFDNYDEFSSDIYLCDDVYRSEDTPTHGTGTILLPMLNDVLKVKDCNILLCGDGCPVEAVVSRASQGYAPVYRVVPCGEIDGNFKALKFKMEIPEPMLEDIKNQGVYEKIADDIESRYYYLLALDEKHYAYITLERKEGAEKADNEAELADAVVKNAKVSFEPKNEKIDLTIERVVRLAENKGERLTWSDFEMYNAVETGSGLYILVYDIDEIFDLMIGGVPASEPMYIRLVTKADRSNYIDIRTENVEAFISKNRAIPPQVEQKEQKEIQIASYIVSRTGEELRVRDIKEYKEYSVSLSFCLDHTPVEGSFYRITGMYDGDNHITVEKPENFHCPQRYAHTDDSDWILSIYAADVRDNGLTVRFNLTDAPEIGHIQTGEWYEIEKYVNDEWQKVDTVISDYGFDDVAYSIKKNETTEIEVDWEWLYGKLTPGHYRIKKELIKFAGTEASEKTICEACFVVSE